MCASIHDWGHPAASEPRDGLTAAMFRPRRKSAATEVSLSKRLPLYPAGEVRRKDCPPALSPLSLQLALIFKIKQKKKKTRNATSSVASGCEMVYLKAPSDSHKVTLCTTSLCSNATGNGDTLRPSRQPLCAIHKLKDS